jgi:Response regulator containing a CheY-like receiver domain and an HTH DNA-binding domain
MLIPKPTLAIVDDHPIVIEGLTKLLMKKEKFNLIGSFTNGQDFVAFLKTTPINIVLLDIVLPGIDGMDLCKEIKNISPATIVLAFSNHQERSGIMKMLENGASGYVLKDASIDELMFCIDEAMNGRITFSKAINDILIQAQLKENRVAKLTKRETEILKLIANGTTTPHIAELLFLSKFTVENHRKNILQKLKAKNVAELISIANQQGLL